MAQLPDLMVGRELEEFEERRGQAGRATDVPDDLATRVAVLPTAYMLLNVIEIAGREGLDAADVARVHFALGERLGLSALVSQILTLPRDDRWQTMARAALRDDLHAVHAQLDRAGARRDLARRAGPTRIAAWEADDQVVVTRAADTLQQICTDEHADLARMSVGLRVVRGLLS